MWTRPIPAMSLEKSQRTLLTKKRDVLNLNNPKKQRNDVFSSKVRTVKPNLLTSSPASCAALALHRMESFATTKHVFLSLIYGVFFKKCVYWCFGCLGVFPD